MRQHIVLDRRSVLEHHMEIDFSYLILSYIYTEDQQTFPFLLNMDFYGCMDVRNLYPYLKGKIQMTILTRFFLERLFYLNVLKVKTYHSNFEHV